MSTPKNLRAKLRQTRIADVLVYRYGPAARRVPARLRRRAVSQSGIRRLPGVRLWPFGAEEIVGRSTSRPSRKAPTRFRSWS